jgi:hypothetical protein
MGCLMALSFAICVVCDERHVLQPSGLMSIHSTAAGERCAGSQPPAPPQPAELREPHPAPVVERRAPGRPTRLDSTKEQRRAALIDKTYEELQEAFDVAREHKLNPRGTLGPTPFDRRIYATEVKVVRGGLPTLGRNR